MSAFETLLPLVQYRGRVREVMAVLAKYGFVDRVEADSPLPIQRILHHLPATMDPEIVAMTTGERLRTALTELGTAWVKLGQMLSLRPDVVGPSLATELAMLQSSVQPQAPGTAIATIERELGAPVKERYGTFNRPVMAAASVAEVHKATLKDRTPVVVKVVRDGAIERSRADLAIMTALAQVWEERDPEAALYRPASMVRQFAQMLTNALDMRAERRNLETVARNFAHTADIEIPKPFPELSSERVLTMSRLTGVAVTSRETIERAGWSVDELVERIARLYLEMIFQHNLFHADPHPGNFLLLPDHRLGVLDFGDVGRISQSRRRELERLVIAIGTDDVDGFVDVLVDITSPPPTTDMNALREDVEAWVMRSLDLGVGDYDIAAILESGMALMHRHQLMLPADLATLFRVVIQLQGLAQQFAVPLDLQRLFTPYLSQMIRDRFNPRRVAGDVLEGARRWDHLLKTLPDDVSAILQQVRQGTIAIDVRLQDPDRLAETLVDGGIAAASMLSASQLIASKAGPKVLGMSGPGLIAAGIGLVALGRVSRRGKPRPSLLGALRTALDIRAGGSSTTPADTALPPEPERSGT
ncbi:MAG: AarF/UbiB family protein [Thermomicrobiales bacterium]